MPSPPTESSDPRITTRIACLVDCISREAGGLQTSVRRLMQLLQTEHTELEVFSVLNHHTAEDAAAWAPVRVNVERGFGPRLFGFSPLLGAAVRHYNAQILNTHGLWTYTSIVSASWQRQTGRPVIIHPHGMLDPWALKNSGWKKKLALWTYERRHLRGAACIRALCVSEMESIRALGLKNPVCIIPNGIDLPAEPPEAFPRPDGDPRPRKLLYLGRLHEKKGIAHLIRAWATLQQEPESRPWQLQIAGWDQGGHEGYLQALASKLGLRWDFPSKSGPPSDTPLVFTGPRFGKDKEAIYAASDGFILPSLSEGLPMVVLEAWAHAKPAIMTPMCNLPEGFAAGAAMRIEPRADSIAGVLLDFMRMPREARCAMGERGWDLAKTAFNWKTISTQLTEVNEWLLNRRPAPPHVHTV